MAKKGVKRIDVLPGTPLISKNSSVIVIPAATAIKFQVAEWFPGTSEAEKKGEVFWIRQSENRGVDYFKQKKKFNDYSLSIPKSLAGGTRFYLEASLTGFKDKEITGVFVRAYAPYRVVKSYWKENTPSNNLQIHNGNPTQFNRPLLLNLVMEGVNDYECIVEIYNCEANLFSATDDQLVGTYTRTVKNGELNLEIAASETMRWKTKMGFKKPKERFYIMIRVKGQKGYIKDTTPKEDIRHAVHLYILNQVGVWLEPVMPKTNKVVTVNENEAKPQKNDHCKFQTISVHDREKVTILFNEKDPKTFAVAEKNYRFSFDLFYGTDQYEVPQESKAILNNIVKFLKNNPQISAKVESFADIRNTHEYNQNLTDKRANRILSYLYTNGVSNRLTVGSYGESKAKQFQYLTNEDRPIHKINRKTAISFDLKNLKRIFYNTILPNMEQQTDLSIYIKGFDTAGCLFKGDKKHDKNKAKYLELVNVNQSREAVKDISISGEKLNLKVFSFEAGMFPTQIALTPNRYELRINSCAYFPDKSQTTVVVNAFTDAVWIIHAVYDYTGKYPLNCRGTAVDTPIVRGVAGLMEKAQPYIDLYLKVLAYFPMMGPLHGELLKLVIEYFKSEAEMYGLGYGKKWNFSGGKFGKEESYAQGNQDLVEKGILTLTILVMIVEIIIAVLTMGESAATKLPKLKKLAKGIKKVQDAGKKVTDLGFDFIFPKVAFTYGSYLEKVNKIVHFVTQFNIKADPVIGIKFAKKLELKDLLANSFIQNDKDLADSLEKEKINRDDLLKDNLKKTARNKLAGKLTDGIGEGFQTLLDRAGVDAKISIFFSGEIKQEYQLKVSAPASYEQYDGKVEVKNQLVSGFNNSAGKSIGESSIKMKGELEAKGRVYLVGCVPIDPFSAQRYFGNFATRIDAFLSASMESHFNHTRTWSAGDREGLYYQDTIYFSGIKGSVQLGVDSNRGDDDTWDVANKKANLINTEFNLFGEHTFKMPKIQFL